MPEFDPEKVGKYITHPAPLYDYQIEAVKEMLEHKKGIVSTPTGTGKTWIAWELFNQLDAPRMMVVVPKLPILRQHADDVRDRLRDLDEISRGAWTKRVKNKGHIFYTTYNSLRMNPEFLEQWDFIFFDEVHHLRGRERWPTLKPYIAKKDWLLGLSATPPQEDESLSASEVREVMPVVYHMDIQKAENRGLVAPQEIHPVPVRLTGEEQIKYQNALDKITYARRKIGTGDPQVIAKIRDEEKPEKLVGAAYTYYQGVNEKTEVLAHADNKYQYLEDILDAHEDEKVMLYQYRIAALSDAVERLNEDGYPTKMMHGGTPMHERRSMLESWGDEFRILGSIKVLSEGVDIPSAGVAIFLGSGKKPRIVQQKIGRILRPLPDKEADIYVVYANNTREVELLQNIVDATSAPIEIEDVDVRTPIGEDVDVLSTIKERREKREETTEDKDLPEPKYTVGDIVSWKDREWQIVVEAKEDKNTGEWGYRIKDIKLGRQYPDRVLEDELEMVEQTAEVLEVAEEIEKEGIPEEYEEEVEEIVAGVLGGEEPEEPEEEEEEEEAEGIEEEEPTFTPEERATVINKLNSWRTAYGLSGDELVREVADWNDWPINTIREIYNEEIR